MIRGARPRAAAGWSLLSALMVLLPAPSAVAADRPALWPWGWSSPDDPEMAAIVAALRAEEAKYRDLEYVARINVRDQGRQDRAVPSEITTMIRRRVVLQGGRSYLRQEAFERVGMNRYRHEETSAFDGERTRTVIGGNCANIHLGRWQHPLIFPAHSLPLAYYDVNLPLSVYLCGTDAIHAYLEYPPGLVDAVPWMTFRKVEVRFEGEEVVDGLRCLKIRADRWYQANQPPQKQHLWLAPARNYHCIKEEHQLYGNQRHEMRVQEWREPAPGLWFLARISVVVSQPVMVPNAPNMAKPMITSRTEMSVEEVGLAPRHPDAFFRDVAIPAGLPVFTIKDRRVVDATLPEPFDDDWGRRNLEHLARRVGEEERRYNDIDIQSRHFTTYPRTSGHNQNIRFDELSEERSAFRGDLAYFSSRRSLALPGGWQDTMFQITAHDGEWTRCFWVQGRRDSPQGTGTWLRRGPMKGAQGLYPSGSHTLMLRQHGFVGSLAEKLTTGTPDRTGQGAWGFRYCGAAEVDGHPCVEVRGDVMQGTRRGDNAIVLYLATDRNHLPIRVESHVRYAGQPILTSLGQVGDFREIATGLWYPSRATESSFDVWAMVIRGWAVLSVRREFTIESIASPSRVGDALFRGVPVPAGAMVQVYDESMQYLGPIQQPEEGVPWLSLKRYLELDARPANPQLQAIRKQALDAAIGRPAPEFPRGARWLGGRPIAPESLRGRAVVLAFWAEWSHDDREALEQLDQFRREAGKEGPIVIGVHPPGSEPVEIAGAIDAMKLGFPTLEDTPGAGGAHAWGEFAGKLGVQTVPAAVLIDREGKVAAAGGIGEVIDRARAPVRERR